MKALVGEFTQNEKWSVKGKLMGECWYKDCCVSEHPNNLRCGKPETVGGNVFLSSIFDKLILWFSTAAKTSSRISMYQIRVLKC